MAHFAQLDENNIVINVIKVNNDDIIDENGNESEELGIIRCQSHFPDTRWIQTSYNNNMRGQYAARGMYYHEDHDIFTYPSPYPSWIFSLEELRWNPPIPAPEGTLLDEGQIYDWNENEQKWIIMDIPNPFLTNQDGYSNYDSENYVVQWSGFEWILIPKEVPNVGIAST
jgi:hypothetical protein